MIVFLYAWLITLVVGWLVIDELYWWWRIADDDLRRTRYYWRETINDLEAAQERIRELQAQRLAEREAEGESWKN